MTAVMTTTMEMMLCENVGDNDDGGDVQKNTSVSTPGRLFFIVRDQICHVSEQFTQNGDKLHTGRPNGNDHLTRRALIHLHNSFLIHMTLHASSISVAFMHLRMTPWIILIMSLFDFILVGPLI